MGKFHSTGLRYAIEFLDDWLAYRYAQCDIPGFNVAIYADDRLIFSRAYGWADVAKAQLLATGHLFGVASQTKMFTATAIMQLVETGKLQLDSPASKYVSWLAQHSDEGVRALTLRQLLSHGAVLPRDGMDTNFWEFKAPFPGQAAFQQLMLATSPIAAPKGATKYSNLAYSLLGLVIEHVSGQAYAAYITRQIIRPLGLSQLFVDYTPAIRAPLATAYGLGIRGERPAISTRRPTRSFAPAVGVHTTAEAMCRFASAHFAGNASLLTDASKEEMQRTQQKVESGYDEGAEFGLGYEVHHVGKTRLIGHSGHLAGYCTGTFFEPTKRLAISVMANCRDAPVMEMIRGIYQALDWYNRYATTETPPAVDKLNVRARSLTAAIQVVAVAKGIIIIDPDDWDPFGWHEKLRRIDDHRLEVMSPGSIFNHGERLQYVFAKNKLKEVRFNGLTLLPD